MLDNLFRRLLFDVLVLFEPLGWCCYDPHNDLTAPLVAARLPIFRFLCSSFQYDRSLSIFFFSFANSKPSFKETMSMFYLIGRIRQMFSLRKQNNYLHQYLVVELTFLSAIVHVCASLSFEKWYT